MIAIERRDDKDAQTAFRQWPGHGTAQCLSHRTRTGRRSACSSSAIWAFICRPMIDLWTIGALPRHSMIRSSERIRETYELLEATGVGQHISKTYLLRATIVIAFRIRSR